MSQKKAVREKRFKVTIELKDVGEFTNFPEAFACFFKEVEKLIKKGTSLQVFETACFLVYDSDFDLVTGKKCLKRQHVLTWYIAKDLAYHLGLMRDNKLVPISVTP